uniref:hypothetical protein n=1 Tax=Klebsiella pneumoniae TaxID=573 RepID=UPI001F4A7B6D
PYRGVSAFLCTRADADQCLEATLNPAVADGLLPALAGLDAKAALASLALEAGRTLVTTNPASLTATLAARGITAGVRALTLFLYGFAAGVFTTSAPATLDLAYELGGLPTYTFKVCPLAVCTVGLSASKPNPALAQLNVPGREGGLEGYTALVGETGRGDGDRM